MAVAPPIPGTHDNVDSFDLNIFDSPPGDLSFDIDHYFTLYPDTAALFSTLLSPFSPADILIGPTGPPGFVSTFAAATSMGLDSTSGCFIPLPGSPPVLFCDSIDALVVFDHGMVGTQDLGDYALFSLAPGSASLAVGAFGAGDPGRSDADVFFTDFSGTFWRYATAADLGLIGVPGGIVGPDKDNIDALEVNLAAAPNPTTSSLLWVLLASFLMVPMRRFVARD